MQSKLYSKKETMGELKQLNIYGVILAAGQGKRMKSKLYKVLHPVCGKPMIGHVLDALQAVQTDRTVVVVGHGAEAVKSYLGNRAEYVLQREQLGTGHAVMQAEDVLKNETGVTIVICGDTPLITSETLKKLLDLHIDTQAAATILTAKLDNPRGYGRIIRDREGAVVRIVEQKDCSPEEEKVQEINTATYCFDNQKLFAALKQITNRNAQQEYYLTDVIGVLQKQGERIAASCLDDPAEASGVNDRAQLAEAERIMRERILRRHLMNGITIIDPANTYIGCDVIIGADTVIFPGTHLSGSTVIGADCKIGPGADIRDTKIGDGAEVMHSVLVQAEIGDRTTVGPFAYLRPGSRIGQGVKIGDFVEIKNSTVADGSKISHLSYVGDAKIGRNVNIGCGAITVNYDGVNKYPTEIADEAFIGSNVNLIAPLKIGKGAYVVAGSTITKDVPDDSMAIARERQTNKPEYALKLKQRLKRKKENQE
jgi:bifunctional UDP-N-acetylglucosamine pyrophosphorylase/glucosamine-1-phosphate N-acetyltransferase